MEKIRSMFTSNQPPNRKRGRENIPAYDAPFLNENRRIVIPPKPAHMTGKSIAPKYSGVSRKVPEKNNIENCDMSNILFGEPIPSLKQSLCPSSERTSARYPTVALFK
jgi:hypothetical protein